MILSLQASRFIFLFCFLLATKASYCQHELRDFGDVPIEDLNSQYCTFDSSASAAVLFDVIKVDLIRGYNYEHHIRIKFFKSNSLEKWGKVKLVYSKFGAKISNIKAATYNLENGTIVATSLNSKSIFYTKVTKNVTQVSFAFPQLRPGSIIEYRYTQRSSTDIQFANQLASLFGLNILETKWRFQHEIPAYRCDFFYSGGVSSTFLQGAIPASQLNDKTEDKGRTVHWFINNVPAFQSEPKSLPQEDVIGMIYVDATDKTWSQLGAAFNKLQQFGITPRDSNSVTGLGEKFKSISNELGRADSIITWVKKNIKWNGDVDRFPDGQFSDIFRDRNGSSCEINLIIMAIMKKAGIRSYPVIISSRGNGAISPDRPRATQFDDVIIGAMVQNPYTKKDEIRLFDGTDRDLHNDYVPLRCLNGLGLLVDGQNSLLIPIAPPKSKKSVIANLYLDEVQDHASGDIEFSYFGLNASDERKSLDSLGEEKYKLKKIGTYPYLDSEPSILNAPNRDRPFKILGKFKPADISRFANDRMYVNPFELSRIQSNPFKSESRLFRIDLNPLQEYVHSFKIVIPKNYAVEEIPKSVAFALPNNDARFTFNIVQHEEVLYITSQVVFNKPIFKPTEYKSLKEFYSLIISKQAEAIVLKKK